MNNAEVKRIVLMIADDWSALGGCYGDVAPETPNIDALAREGMVFDRAYCSSPSCGPSRATILTGLNSYSHGQYGNPHGNSAFRIRENVKPVTRWLAEAGIKSGIIGKRHVMPIEPFQFAYCPQSEGALNNSETQTRLSEFFQIVGRNNFFLMLGSSLPHRTGKGYDNPKFAEMRTRTYSADEVRVPDFLPDLPEVRQDLAEYYTAVTRFDDWVGTVVNRFRSEGLYDGTLFLVMSDHAMPFVGAKATPFETGVRCPFIATCPGVIPAGKRSDAIICWTDIAATILHWVGADGADKTEGISFANTLRGTGTDSVETYLTHMNHGVIEYYPWRVLLRKKWKYILRTDPELPLPIPTDLLNSLSFQAMMREGCEFFGKRKARDVLYAPREALYDLESDPMETRNLAEAVEHAEVLNELRQALHKHRVRTHDPLLQKEGQLFWQSVFRK